VEVDAAALTKAEDRYIQFPPDRSGHIHEFMAPRCPESAQLRPCCSFNPQQAELGLASDSNERTILAECRIYTQPSHDALALFTDGKERGIAVYISAEAATQCNYNQAAATFRMANARSIYRRCPAQITLGEIKKRLLINHNMIAAAMDLLTATSGQTLFDYFSSLFPYNVQWALFLSHISTKLPLKASHRCTTGFSLQHTDKPVIPSLPK
jgi:hypothetical protein